MKRDGRFLFCAARRALLRLASNESLFVIMAVISAGVLSMGPLYYYQEQAALVERYIVAPWGMALCLLRLDRRAREPGRLMADTALLGALFCWMVVPFALRFGVTFNNMSCWIGYATVYFGVYAMVTEEGEERRERLFDTLCAAAGVFSLIFGGALLYTAATVQTLGALPEASYGFGLADGMYLCSGVHYNITGMIAVCCAMICMAGVARWRSVPLRALSLAAALMMMIVVVLTQSRTARYALIAALAVGGYALAAGGRRTAARQALGILTAVAVLVGSYTGASALSNAAIAHYERTRISRAEASVTEAAASPKQTIRLAAAEASEIAESPAPEANDEARPEAAPDAKPLAPRAAVDASFSGRTDIWRNLVKIWRENPRHLLIGSGVGRIGSQVVKGTIHESLGAVSIHNTYLQFIADFGLVGFALKVLFFLAILRPVLRVFFAPGAKRRGELPLCMLVVACLLTGMMESAPLGWMTPMNVLLYLSLGLLVSKGRQLEPKR